MKELGSLIERDWEQIIADYRWLHAHPELSGQEEKTAAYIADALQRMGLEPTEHVGGYGVTALIEGMKPGKCIGLRADFDALPVTESTGLPFASQNPGVMHACGHDMHTAMLLGVARILCNMRDRFSGCVKLIFQPSEEKSASKEGKSGAKAMIADGVLCNPPVDTMIGQHLEAMTPTGSVTFRSGAMMAASDSFVLTIHGKGAHASKPDQGIDAIAVSAQIISALQTIISRNVSPLDNAVITIGTITGGTAGNVLAETVEMTGTCRNLDARIRSEMPGRMEAIIKGVAEGMGAGYTFHYQKGYPPAINDFSMCEILHAAAVETIGEAHIIPKKHPSLGAEDFAFYAEEVPAVIYNLGCLKEGAEAWPLHSGHFAPDEETMKTGISVMTAATLRFLKGM